MTGRSSIFVVAPGVKPRSTDCCFVPISRSRKVCHCSLFVACPPPAMGALVAATTSTTLRAFAHGGGCVNGRRTLSPVEAPRRRWLHSRCL